jgi:hypothetical protein
MAFDGNILSWPKKIAIAIPLAAPCFNTHYRMGRRSPGVKMDVFVACVNEHSGTQFFSAEPGD